MVDLEGICYYSQTSPVPEFRIYITVDGSVYDVRLAGRAALYAPDRPITLTPVDNPLDANVAVYDRADDREWSEA